GQTGLEFIVDSQELMMTRGRVFYLDDRFYQIIVGGKREHLHTPEADAFLNSFNANPEKGSTDPTPPPNGSDKKGSQTVHKGWEKGTTREGPLEVMLPGQPKRKPRPRLDDGREQYQYVFEVTPNSGYIISVSAVPNAEQAAGLRRLGDAEFHLDF